MRISMWPFSYLFWSKREKMHQGLVITWLFLTFHIPVIYSSCLQQEFPFINQICIVCLCNSKCTSEMNQEPFLSNFLDTSFWREKLFSYEDILGTLWNIPVRIHMTQSQLFTGRMKNFTPRHMGKLIKVVDSLNLEHIYRNWVF